MRGVFLCRNGCLGYVQGFACILFGVNFFLVFSYFQMGSRCFCFRWSRSFIVFGIRFLVSGSARVWRCACARWRRRIARFVDSLVWFRVARRRIVAVIILRFILWRRVLAIARIFASVSWRVIVSSVGSSRSWRSAR